MSLTSISERIAALTDTHKDCINQISLLSKTTQESDRTSLATQIHHTLRDAESTRDLLLDTLLTAPSTPALLALRAKLSKLSEDLKLARLSYRKALLASKRNAVLSESATRESLLGGASARASARAASGKSNQAVEKGDLLVSASGDVTEALRRTQALMAEELTRSRFASETLAISTEALRDLSSRYSAFDDVLGRSKELIRDLVKKNKSDRWYYEKAIQILLGTLIWIILRRLFWGPVYMLLFMPVKSVVWLGGTVWGLAAGGEKGLDGKGARDAVGEAKEAVYSEITTTDVLVEEKVGSETTTMLEKVGMIIDGGETTYVPNTKSRRFEYDAAMESRMSESKSEEAEASATPSMDEEVAEESGVDVEDAVPEQVEERHAELVKGHGDYPERVYEQPGDFPEYLPEDEDEDVPKHTVTHDEL